MQLIYTNIQVVKLSSDGIKHLVIVFMIKVRISFIVFNYINKSIFSYQKPK